MLKRYLPHCLWNYLISYKLISLLAARKCTQSRFPLARRKLTFGLGGFIWQHLRSCTRYTQIGFMNCNWIGFGVAQSRAFGLTSATVVVVYSHDWKVKGRIGYITKQKNNFNRHNGDNWFTQMKKVNVKSISIVLQTTVFVTYSVNVHLWDKNSYVICWNTTFNAYIVHLLIATSCGFILFMVSVEYVYRKTSSHFLKRSFVLHISGQSWLN